MGRLLVKQELQVCCSAIESKSGRMRVGEFMKKVNVCYPRAKRVRPAIAFLGLAKLSCGNASGFEQQKDPTRVYFLL
jgi:hypothetical protein